MMYWNKQKTDWGTIFLCEEDGILLQVCLAIPRSPLDGERRVTPTLQLATEQIREYLSGKRQVFQLPFQLQGTSFQLKVWDALQKIPYGTTISYKQLAEMVGSPRGYRAVGMANHKNPLPLIVPCHRVIGTRGTLVGFAPGLEWKRRLLALEQEVQGR